MNYRGYDIVKKGSNIVVEGVTEFNPVHVFECGQCFRWLRENDGSYTGVAKGRVINVRFNEGKLIIENSTIEEFLDIWFEYFDLGRDYSIIKQKIAKDEIIKKAIEFGEGIRTLKQDLWETLISFIISANNRIPMIMKVVSNISQMYGNEIYFDGKTYYSFPQADVLSCSELEKLEVCKGGFRCKYILASSRTVENGIVRINSLHQCSTHDARKLLTRLTGVGNKVADCVLLYSGTKYDVFPTDLWVKRVMEELYFKREVSFKEIQEFARHYFGELSGFAQQYLFFYAREKKIGAK